MQRVKFKTGNLYRFKDPENLKNSYDFIFLEQGWSEDQKTYVGFFYLIKENEIIKKYMNTSFIRRIKELKSSDMEFHE